MIATLFDWVVAAFAIFGACICAARLSKRDEKRHEEIMYVLREEIRYEVRKIRSELTKVTNPELWPESAITWKKTSHQSDQ